MTREQWERVKEIFGDALERAPAEREAFIRNAAGDDRELFDELLRMLQENERDSDLLSHLALADARALRPDDHPRFSTGTVLARRFRIARFISRGGMGEVYEAEDLDLGERVALKAIRPRIAYDPDVRALFKREIQLARRVTHPNVCRIFDLHEDALEGEPAVLLSMELIEGQTLAHYLREHGPWLPKDALPLIGQIAAGLQAVHDAGVIHGDLKPGNVMLTPDLQAKVMDFGVALPRVQAESAGFVSSESSPRGTGTGPLRGGTPEYLAPEQQENARPSTLTDIYAFALVIRELLGLTRAEINGEKRRLPGRWSRVLRRCLERDPARRFSRPADVANALRAGSDRRPKPRTIAIAAAAAGVLSAIGFIAARRIELSPSNRLVVTEGREEVRSVSPNGRFLAETSWDTGDLAVYDIASGRTKRLTHKSTTWEQQFGGAYSALFSPDGRSIAYVWLNSRTDSEIRMIGTDGKGARTLYHGPGSADLIDWSADGGGILAALFDGEGAARQLALISPRTGNVEKLQDPAHGNRVAFGAEPRSLIFDTELEIHRLLPGGSEQTLVGRTGRNSVIGWAPDRRLIFSSDRRGHAGIWAIQVSDRGAAGEARELIPDARDWEPIGLTRNGGLFYRHNADLVDVYTAAIDLAQGRTVSAPQRVTERFIGTYAYPNWSEDGKQLVFDSNRYLPASRLGIYEPRNGKFRELPIELTRTYRPQWIEHGAAIIIPGRAADGRDGFFRIDPQTGAASLVRTSDAIGSHFEGIWSRDGKFHFNRFDDFRRGIFRFDLGTGERRVLYVPPPGVDVGTENLSLSPDGKTLAFQARGDGQASLMLISVSGGEPKSVFPIRTPRSFPYGAFTWTPDSQNLLAAVSIQGRTPGEQVSEIWQVPVDGSAPVKIDFPALWITSLRLNPDGKTLAFQVRQRRNEIWVSLNFL